MAKYQRRHPGLALSQTIAPGHAGAGYGITDPERRAT